MGLTDLAAADADLFGLGQVALDLDEVAHLGHWIGREHVVTGVAVVLLLGHSAQLPLGLHDRGHRTAVGLGLDGRINGTAWPAGELVEQPLGHDDRGRDDCRRAVVQIVLLGQL